MRPSALIPGGPKVDAASAPTVTVSPASVRVSSRAVPVRRSQTHRRKVPERSPSSMKTASQRPSSLQRDQEVAKVAGMDTVVVAPVCRSYTWRPV